MSNVNSLLKRVNAMLAAIENRQQQQASSCIVLYDPDTGVAIPGHEPKGTRVTFWIPDNKRDYNLGPYKG